MISIQTIAGHILFACTVGDLGNGIGDVSLDSWACLEGMINTVKRTGHSSFYVEKGMSALGKSTTIGTPGESFPVNGGGLFVSQFLIHNNLNVINSISDLGGGSIVFKRPELPKVFMKESECAMLPNCSRCLLLRIIARRSHSKSCHFPCGLSDQFELNANGQLVASTIRDYLTKLRRNSEECTPGMPEQPAPVGPRDDSKVKVGDKLISNYR